MNDLVRTGCWCFNALINEQNMYLVYYTAVILLSVLSIAFHALGLFALSAENEKTNHTNYLISLSIVDVIISIYRIVFEIFLYYCHDSVDENGWTLAIFLSVFYITIYAGVFTMSMITIDRFMCAWNPLMYASRMTKRRTTIILIASWMVSVAVGVGTGASPLYLRRRLNIFGGSVVCVYLIWTVFTYAIIFRSLRRYHEQFRTPLNDPTNRGAGITFKNEFLVPTVLISTFIVFYLIPVVMTFVIRIKDGEFERRQESVLYCLCMFLPHVGVLADAVTYIFLVKIYRDNFIQLWRRCYMT